MTPSRHSPAASPVVCPLHPTDIQHLTAHSATSNIRRPRRLIMTPSRQPLLASPVVCPADLHRQRCYETAVETRAHYEILSISLSLLNAFSPTLVMGTNQMAL